MDTSRAQFDRCIPILLANEGGLVHDARDPGGLTNYGISQRRYPHLDIAHLTRAAAVSIYYRDFWQPMHCGSLPPGLDLCVFDFGVNAGPRPAVRALQRLLDTAADGHIGPKTLAALAHCAHSTRTLVDLYAHARLRFYRRLSTWPRFGRGWTRRVEHVRTDALQMVLDP